MTALMIDERYLTVAEIASKLHVTEWTVRQWLQAGKLRGSRPGGKRAGWRVRESDFEQYMNATANRPDEEAEA